MTFRISGFSEWKGPIETLRLTRDPWRNGIGIYTDANGVEWHVYGLFTHKSARHVWARPTREAPSYYSTAGDGHNGGQHRWPPYKLEVIEQTA